MRRIQTREAARSSPPPPPPKIAGPARRGLTQGPGARPPQRDVRARRDHSRGPGHACTVPPPPIGRYSVALSLCTANTASRMTRRDIAYPPFRALPPPSPYRMGRRGPAAAGFPQPPADLGAADAPLGGAERPGAGPPPLAHPCEPRVAPPPRAHGEVPCSRRLRAPRPLGAVLPPPQPRGHPHGMLPPLDGHGRGPYGGLSALQRVPRGPAVSGPALHEALSRRYGVAAPLWRSPRLHWRRHAALLGRPPVGAPLGPGSPPRPPPRRLGPALPSAVCSWSRGGTTRRRAHGAIGWVSPTAAPSSAFFGATGPSPRPRTRSRPPARCWPPSRACTPCGTW